MAHCHPNICNAFLAPLRIWCFLRGQSSAHGRRVCPARLPCCLCFSQVHPSGFHVHNYPHFPLPYAQCHLRCLFVVRSMKACLLFSFLPSLGDYPRVPPSAGRPDIARRAYRAVSVLVHLCLISLRFPLNTTNTRHTSMLCIACVKK